MKLRRALLAVLALSAACVPLAACSLIEQTVTQSVQDAVREATGGDVELTDGVPADFPEDEIPLVEGTVRGGSQDRGATTHWVVVVTGDVTAERAEKSLLDAGFTVHNAVSQADLGSVSTLSSEGYDVTLVTADGSVVYAVTTRN